MTASMSPSHVPTRTCPLPSVLLSAALHCFSSLATARVSSFCLLRKPLARPYATYAGYWSAGENHPFPMSKPSSRVGSEVVETIARARYGIVVPA